MTDLEFRASFPPLIRDFARYKDVVQGCSAKTVNEYLTELGCPNRVRIQIDVAIDELFSNIARYAYGPKPGSATVRVDVVMLQADSDEAWREILVELSIKDTSGVTSWLGDIDEPAQRTTWDGAPVFRVIASHDKHAIGFYKLENETQYNALLDYQLNKIK